MEAGSLGTNVGGIYYEVSLDTKKMVDEQRRVDAELQRTTQSFDGFKAQLTTVAAAVGVLVAAMARLKLAALADEMRLLKARVEVAAGSVEKGSAAFADLVAIGRRTQSSLEGNIEVFNRLNQSILQMGGTQQDTLHITELLGKAIKVSGASATEAKAAMLQFGQALGSGKLQGDELRSLMETAPYLMKQLADGIGVPIGALKKLGEEGKLTSDVVVNALSKAADKIDADFEKFPQTIAGAMQVAQDQAALLALEYDKLTGGSAMLTGATKGLTQVIEELAAQFRAAQDGTANLSRNEVVAQWADDTRTALSYLVDAVDTVWQAMSVLGRNVAFVFKGIGTEIGGIGAQVAAVLRGDFAGARAIGEEMTADAEKRRKELDEADAKTLARAQTMGQKMREAWAKGTGKVKDEPAFTPSKLKPPAGLPPDKQKFDSAAYLGGLEKAAAEGYAKVDAIEKEALRKNQQLLTEGKISRQEAAKASVLIEEDAARERLKVGKAELAELKKDIKTSSKEVAELEKQAAQDRQRAIEYGAQLTRAANPVDALRQEYDAKLEIVTQYEQMMAQAGVDATTQGQLARTEITRQYELQRQALAEQSFRSQSDANALLIDSLNAFNQTATQSLVGLFNGTMTAQDAMRGLANTILNEAVGALVKFGIQQVKNALTAKTLEAADKARSAAQGAVYAASVTAQVAGMSAMAAQNAFAATAAIPIVGPALAPGAAAAAAAAASALGAPAIATAPLAGARQYGGPVAAGSMYRVGEGNRPEMFVGDSGRSYMIPGERGQVIGNDDLQRSAPTRSAQGVIGDINISVAVAVQSDGSAKTETGASGADQATARALGERMAAVSKQTMLEELRPNGLLWKLKNGQA